MDRRLNSELKKHVYDLAAAFIHLDFAEILMSQLETLKSAGSIEDAELATLQILHTQVLVTENALSIEVVLALQELPDTVLRPYAQSFITAGGANRMTEANWATFFPVQTYSSLFRFERRDMLTLIAALRIPAILHFPGGYKSNCHEALHLVLRRLSSPGRWIDIAQEFDMRPQLLSVVFNNTVMLLFDKWGSFIRSLDHDFLERDYLDIFANAFQRKGCPLPNTVCTIDGTKNCISRPGHGLQVAAYCGHHHSHCLGYQFVELPVGVNIVFGPFNGFEHDSSSVKMIQLEELLTEKFDFSEEGGVAYKAFLDSGYALGNTFITPFSRRRQLNEEERRFNREMSRMRQPSEWGIGRVKTLFSFLEFKKSLRVLAMPLGPMFLIAVHLKNIHGCLYGSQTAQYFDVPTLSIFEYLGLEV